MVDSGRFKRALKMLKKEAFQIYISADDEKLIGVVKSQTSSDKVYTCRMGENGKYACADGQLEGCMGLQGQVCKHLIVLVIGAVHHGDLTSSTAQNWIGKCVKRRPASDEQDALADTLLMYRGAEAGEIDWRPMETVPEDFYAY